MAVLNAHAASLLDEVKFDPKSPANLNYVKARIAIDDTMKSRRDRRAAKMVVITHLNGALHHPDPAARLKGATNQVVFPDGSKARF